MTRLFLITLALMLSGCISGYFQPPKPAYKYWIKPGASELDVKKAFLECQAPTPNPLGFQYELAFGFKENDEIQNHILLISGCMEKAGYTSTTASFIKICSLPHNSYLPACQPNADIPLPSLESRLNSWYCKLKTDREYCRAHAFRPSGCDDPKKDYDNPPPECIP